MQRAACTRFVLSAVFLFALTVVGTQAAHAQTFAVLHTFTGLRDGGNPLGGVVIDRAGNLYGTTEDGGQYFSGLVFKLTRRNSSWLFSPLYSFQGGDDGALPIARVIIGPNGSLYGTTYEGGDPNCSVGSVGCGIVFNLRPPSHTSPSIIAPWTETVLYRFTGNDGAYPGYGDLTFDNAGNIYGTTIDGGHFGGPCDSSGCGVVFELTPFGSSWLESLVYAFLGSDNDGWIPEWGVAVDSAGSLYGTLAAGGAYGRGTAYQLTPTVSGWTENPIYWFQGGNEGEPPTGGLVFDQSGNLYGGTAGAGPWNGGTVYELVNSQQQFWTFNLAYGFNGSNGPMAPALTIDAAGNLYGTTYDDGLYNVGSVFKLTPRNGGWTYTDLYDFTGGDDGANPASSVTLDASGNLYGTTQYGGPNCLPSGCGVIWEITP